ncbi:hypothetical protein PVK73_15900 [Bacillus thuringiensis]
MCNVEKIIRTRGIAVLPKIKAKFKGKIEGIQDFDEQLEKMQKMAFNRLGKRPPIEDIDTDWIFEEESEVVH